MADGAPSFGIYPTTLVWFGSTAFFVAGLDYWIARRVEAVCYARLFEVKGGLSSNKAKETSFTGLETEQCHHVLFSLQFDTATLIIRAPEGSRTGVANTGSSMMGFICNFYYTVL